MSQKEEEDPNNTQGVSVEAILASSLWFKAPELIEEELTEYINRISHLVLKHSGLLSYVDKINISLLLTDDSELQRLNRDFRYQDKPTNVLSFPAHEINLFNYQDLSLDEDNALFLGDIAISYERILEESIEQQKFFKEHFTHILVHSILHLIGYDHIDEHDADKMEQLEINILSSIGFKNPYILRDLDDQYLIKLK